MVKQQVIFADGNELVLLLKGKGGREPHMLQAESVQRISFGYVPNFFTKFNHKYIRAITVVAKGLGTIVYEETRHKNFFETYIPMLRDYCKRNHVTFYDFKEE